MHCLISSGLAIAIISTLCSWTFARMPSNLPTVLHGGRYITDTKSSMKSRGSTRRDLKFDASFGTHPLNVECHVGSLCTLQNFGLFKLDKTLIPSWLILKNANKSTFHGIPTAHDVGTHILPEIGLVVQVTYSARELATACRLHRTSPTVAVISIDTDLPAMVPSERIALFSRLANLLHSGSPNVDLSSIYYLSRAQHQPESLKSLFMLATGPGNTHTMRTNGSLLAWRVGCGSVAPSQLASLQRLEKTAVTGELARIIGFPVRQWFVADDKRLLMEARRMRRSRMRRSPTVDQWGPGAANYIGNEGSGGTYDYPTGEYGSGYFNNHYGGGQGVSPQSVTRPEPPILKEDNLPTVQKSLPLYMVKQNVKGKKFRIPDWTFADKEDGDASRMRLELMTSDQRNVNDMERRWLKFDALTITVIDPSMVPVGNYSFNLVAYDSRDNQVSQILIIRVLPTDSSVPMEVIRFEIRPGEYFNKYLSMESQRTIDHNVDDDKELRSFTLEEINSRGEIVKRTTPWVKFHPIDLKFYGFPTLNLMDQKVVFRLSVQMKYATRKENSPSGFFRVEFTITSRRQKGLTHTIAMNVSNPRFSADEFLRNPWLQVEFIDKLKLTFNEKTNKYFLIQNVKKAYDDDYSYYLSRRVRRQSRYSNGIDNTVTVEWAHRSAFAMNGKCNIHALRVIMNRLFEKLGGQVVWKKQTVEKMQPFQLYSFHVRALGVCERNASEVIPNPNSYWLGQLASSGILIETPTRPPPYSFQNKKMYPITVFEGIMFKKQLVPADADINPNRLSFEIQAIRESSVNSSGGQPSWIKICNNKLCGLAMREQLGVKQFEIEARDDNDGVTRYEITVHVKRYPNAKNLNHLVTMIVYPKSGNSRESFETWRRLDNLMLLLRNLELFLDPNCDQGFGRNCGQGIAFLGMKIKNYNAVVGGDPIEKGPPNGEVLEVDWASTELYINRGCPRDQIQELQERLYTRNKYSRVIHLGETMEQIGLTTVAISLGYSGACLDDGSDSYTQATAPVKGDERGLSTWKILLIVGTILILITLPAGAIALFCMRSSRRKKKEGAEAAATAAASAAASRAPEKPSSSRMMEREPLNKPQSNRSGMFDEMDDAPSAPTKPLILPHEKPPVPPPDFGVFDLNSRPTPAPATRSTTTTMPRRPLNPYRNMPPNFDDTRARHV